jgi:hypothetical protein
MKALSPYLRAVLYGILALLMLTLLSVGWAILEMVVLNPAGPDSEPYRLQLHYIESLTVFYAAVAIPIIILFAWRAARRVPPGKALTTGLIVALVCVAVELGVQIAAAGVLPSPVLLTLGVALSKLLSGLLGGWLALRTVPIDGAA